MPPSFRSGTELTRGELINTNASWLGERLTELGFDVVEHVVVDDRPQFIVDTLKRLGQIASVVVSTGGLGPTSDDRTSEAVAIAMGVSLHRDESTIHELERKWQKMGLAMPESNRKQADFPVGSSIIENQVGTAPAFAAKIGGAHCFFLPGVPREMKHLFHEVVAPDIAGSVERTTHQLHLRSFGFTESQIADQLEDLESLFPGVTVGYRAHFPEIEIKVLAKAEDEASAQALSEKAADVVRERLSSAVFGDRDDTFAGAVGRALRDRGLTLAVAESCTGGMIGSMITSVPGSSDYLLLDAVVYANSAKTRVLGVSEETLRGHGAVSEETVASMAEGALRISDADLAVAVTGIAGPGGGSEDRPVGTVWFALARRGQATVTKLRHLRGDRSRIRTLSSYVALRMVLRAAREDR